MALFGLFVPPFALRAHRRGVNPGRYLQRYSSLFLCCCCFLDTRSTRRVRRRAHGPLQRPCGCGERPVFNPQESDTPQYRYEPNAAATQKSESCGHRVRRSATQHATGGARAVEGSRLAEARAVGIAHVAICVFSVSVSVGVPEASAAHAHALPPLLADDDLR